MNLGFPEMAKIVKPGRVGVAEVTHYTVTKLDVLRELMHGGPAEEGTVAILRVAGRTMMSDTRHERLTNWEVRHKAQGNVLIAGLGIGMVLHAIVPKDEVKAVTVVEKEPDVVKLISSTLPKSYKLKVVCADIFDWRPPEGAKFDCIYFDIWADGSDDLAKIERRRLSARFRKYKAANGWMKSWKPMSYR